MAGPLWLNSGKLILSAGKAVLCGNCPCVTSCCSGIPVGTVRHLTVSGAPCACLNGTFTLTSGLPVGGVSTFLTGPEFTFCATADPDTFNFLNWIWGCHVTFGVFTWILSIACTVNPSELVTFTQVASIPAALISCDTTTGYVASGHCAGVTTPCCVGGTGAFDWSITL